MVHKLKLDSVYYEDSLTNAKTFEIRKNDRGFRVGDILDLWEWDDIGLKLTGRHHAKIVTYMITRHLKPGYVCIGLQPISISAARALDAQV